MSKGKAKVKKEGIFSFGFANWLIGIPFRSMPFKKKR